MSQNQVTATGRPKRTCTTKPINPPPPSSGEPSTKRTKQTTRVDRGKGHMSDTPIDPNLCAFPWPRPAKQPFTLDLDVTSGTLSNDRRWKNRDLGPVWDDFDSLFYNCLLKSKFKASRFVDKETLASLDLLDDVTNMLEQVGFDFFPFTAYPLYKDLARQFLASVRLRHINPKAPRVSETYLCFIVLGQYHELTMKSVCEIMGFNPIGYKRFMTTFTEHQALWELIGRGNFKSRAAKQARIRNPAIRIFARILSLLFYGKDDAGALREAELEFIHFGISQLIGSIYENPQKKELHTNLGFLFSEILVDRKMLALANPTRVEVMGSLITPILDHIGIPVTRFKCKKELCFMDMSYLRTAGMFGKNNVYKFTNLSGAPLQCLLPNSEITRLVSVDNIRFLPGSQHLVGGSAGTTNIPLLSGGPSRNHPRSSHTQVPDSDSDEQVDYSEFDLPPRRADMTPDEKLEWIMTSQERNNAMMRRNNSLMRRLKKTISRLRPSCFRSPSRDRQHSDEDLEPAFEAAHVSSARACSNDGSPSDDIPPPDDSTPFDQPPVYF